MKSNLGTIIGFMIVLGVGGLVALSQSGAPVVYEKQDNPANETAVETPAWLQDKDAVAAAEAVVKRKELEQKEAELQAQIEALQTELGAVQKELDAY
jgi:hypothetical protein